jgi:NAD(P)-dependent dehydrogenase (short-subunit alcohol dehydrogenase family)
MARILVTGATGALGGATVDRLLAEGHALACVARSIPPATSGSVHWFACDLTKPDEASETVAKANAALGGLDGLVLLAGAFAFKRVEGEIVEEWRRLQQVNVDTALSVLGPAIPLLSDGGAIVTIGAATAQTAGAGTGPYAAAKSGIARLTEALAAELAPRRIRANSVLPRIIDTAANREAMPRADRSPWTSPAAIADVIAFLIDDRSRGVNGAHVPVTNAA